MPGSLLSLLLPGSFRSGRLSFEGVVGFPGKPFEMGGLGAGLAIMRQFKFVGRNSY